MDKPDQKSASFPELQAANVEYTAEQYRALYYELVEKAVLPRDIVTLFQNPREEASWEEFWRALKKEYRVIDTRDLTITRFVLDDSLRGYITKSSLIRFYMWFWPILPDEDFYETATTERNPSAVDHEDNYVTTHQYDKDDPALDEFDGEEEGLPDAVEGVSPSQRSQPPHSSSASESASTPRWQVSTIASNILSKTWFHGFISAAQARERLQNERQGTFLMRFSSVAPHYALDMQDGHRVRHWRVEFRPSDGDFTIFKERYPSLQGVVDVHVTIPLKLASGGAAPLLRDGLPRTAWDPSLALQRQASPSSAPASTPEEPHQPPSPGGVLLPWAGTD